VQNRGLSPQGLSREELIQRLKEKMVNEVRAAVRIGPGRCFSCELRGKHITAPFLHLDPRALLMYAYSLAADLDWVVVIPTGDSH
jgi:hypothetical protein